MNDLMTQRGIQLLGQIATLRPLTAIAFLFLLASCASQTPTFTLGQLRALGARQVDSQGLTDLISDRTFYGTYLNNEKRWIEYYSSDGRLAYDGGGRPDFGSWWISDDEACFEYELSDPGPFCFFFYRLDGRVYGVDNVNGDSAAVFFVVDEMKVGDVDGLSRL